MSLADGQKPSWQDKLAQICLEGKIYCSSPRDFNDPFDCLPNIASPTERDAIEGLSEKLVANFISALPELPPDEIEREARNGLLSLSPEQLRVTSTIASERTASNMGVYCLSECIDSVLMWSHYANNHTGIALKFEPLLQPRGGLMPLLRVSYDENRPMVSYFESEGTVRFADALTSKAAFWSYEREWRKIVPNGAGRFLEFDTKVVTGVVFGVNCRAALREAVKAVIDNRSLKFWEAVSSPNKFELLFRRLDER